MSYEQQNWVTGNIITAEKLNHMEEGIASAQGGGGTPLVVNESATADGGNTIYTLDKTWKEISDAFPNVYVLMDNPNHPKVSVLGVAHGIRYTVSVMDISNSVGIYDTDAENGYPTFTSTNK